MVFFQKSKSYEIKVNLLTHACLRRNLKLFLILTLWRHSKCKDLLHMLNVCKSPAKEHQVVFRSATDEISVS